jgi:1,4-alpha-glucan branching enzyme
VALAPSTWGSDKDMSTWDSPRVGHMAIAARRSELRTVAATAGHLRPRAALERAARELLAVQASDWAFMATRELAGDYPRERLEAHEAGLEAALAALGGETGAAEVISRAVPEPALRNLAPDLDLASLTSP